MTWLQFMIGTDGMSAMTKHGLIWMIREGICNFAFFIIISLVFFGLIFLIGCATYDYIKMGKKGNFWY